MAPRPRAKGAANGAFAIGNRMQAETLPRIKQRQEETGEPYTGRSYVRIGPTSTAILLGNEDISTWTDDELRNGKRHGTPGKTPSVIPMALHDELVRRTLVEAKSHLTDALIPALEAIRSIIDNPMAKDSDKIKAAEMIIDRIMGKAVERIEVNDGTTAAWKDVILEGSISIEDAQIIDVKEA